MKEAATRVRGNGTTVSLHELMLGRGFDAAAGDIPRYMMRSGRAPFKTERVEVGVTKKRMVGGWYDSRALSAEK